MSKKFGKKKKNRTYRATKVIPMVNLETEFNTTYHCHSMQQFSLIHTPKTEFSTKARGFTPLGSFYYPTKCKMIRFMHLNFQKKKENLFGERFLKLFYGFIFGKKTHF